MRFIFSAILVGSLLVGGATRLMEGGVLKTPPVIQTLAADVHNAVAGTACHHPAKATHVMALTSQEVASGPTGATLHGHM